MHRSSIEWTEFTWNPVRGCTEISPGCDHCYARTFAERFRGVEGHPYEYGFDFRLVPHLLEKPLRIKTPRMIFVNSMSDLFYGKSPTDYLRDVTEVMLQANWHIFQVLTKRSPRMKRLLNSSDPVFAEAAEAKHIWWGVSAENRKHGFPRLKDLQETNASVKWASLEPLLEDLGDDVPLEGMDWAVVGGESGNGARLVEEEWIERIRRKCKKLGIPFLFKQWGGVKKGQTGRTLNGRTYDEYPPIEAQPVPGREERRAMVARTRAKIREVWLQHELAVEPPQGYFQPA